MLEEVKCNICGCESHQILYKSTNQSEDKSKYLITESLPEKPRQIVKCNECGLIYANYVKSPEELNLFYINMSDEDYKNEEKGRRISAGKILKRLKKFNKTGRILDVGCATGFLLDEARKGGWEAHGVELSKWCVDYAKKILSLDIFCGELKDAHFKDGFFDAIVLNDVIEHLPDPKNALKEIRRLMKPDGIICINTPDIDSLVSRLLRARWWGINQAHLFYFTKETLFKMLNSAGFAPFECIRHARTFSFNYWVFRFRNYNTGIYKTLKFLADHSALGSRLFTINTADQIEVYAKTV
ncbi:MAG: class I SAM-dependent methyltransferase [Candidatus Omnitrophota bacterium]|nr:class I SAM-dependent methyltransferase [Candidatus Omnitrophota bacterium]